MPEPARFQFRLSLLFLVTTAVGLMLALGQAIGWRHALWVLPVVLNPYTIGNMLGAWAERSN